MDGRSGQWELRTAHPGAATRLALRLLRPCLSCRWAPLALLSLGPPSTVPCAWGWSLAKEEERPGRGPGVDVLRKQDRLPGVTKQHVLLWFVCIWADPRS